MSFWYVSEATCKGPVHRDSPGGEAPRKPQTRAAATHLLFEHKQWLLSDDGPITNTIIFPLPGNKQSSKASIPRWEHKMGICRERKDFTVQASFCSVSEQVPHSASSGSLPWKSVPRRKGNRWELVQKAGCPSTAGSILGIRHSSITPVFTQGETEAQNSKEIFPGGRGRAGLSIWNQAWSAGSFLTLPPLP